MFGWNPMFNYLLLYLGAGLTAMWGISHLFPTKSVVKGFGDISEDNKLIFTVSALLILTGGLL